MHKTTTLLLCLVCAQLAFGNAVGGQNPPPHSSTVVRTESTHAVRTPILLTVTVTNNGDQPIGYWTQGARYPPGFWFSSTITDDRGGIIKVELSNQESGPGSGGFAKIEPRHSVIAPVMIDPLPVGSYTIQVWNGKSASFTVKDDPQLARKWDQDIVARIRKGETFAIYVACKYLGGKEPRQSLIDPLLQELLSDNNDVAGYAVDPLLRLKHLRPGSSAIVSKAFMNRISKAKEGNLPQEWLLTRLGFLAARIGSDEALEPVLALAQTEQLRGAAIRPLGAFKQEKAVKELRLFLTDEVEGHRFEAARVLSERKDPQALEVLLIVAHDPKSQLRMYSFESLLKFPNDPRVEKAIKTGMADPDTQVREFAQIALRNLTRQKKEKP